MSVDWQNLFKPPSDPGVYGPESDYKPDPRSENPYVPENWGDILGQMLGTYGNVRRAQRNMQAQSLINAWNEAKAQGPEAAQAFLRNPQLPDWFKSKILNGITPEMFDPAIKAKAQKIYGEAFAAMQDVYAKAAAIQDPAQRDQFVDQQLEALKIAYPEWADRLRPPRGLDGHYVIPSAARPSSGKKLGQVAPALVKALEGTSLATLLDGPADAFLLPNGELDMEKIRGLLVDAQNERTSVLERGQATARGARELASGTWVDPNTMKPVKEGTPGAMWVPSGSYSAFEKPGGKTGSAAHAKWAAQVQGLTRFANSLRTQLHDLQGMRNNVTTWGTMKPEEQQALIKRMQRYQDQLDKVDQQLRDLSTQDPDLTEPSDQGPGAGGAPVGGKPGWWWYRNQKGVLLDAIRQAEGVDSYGVQKGDYSQNRAGAAQIVDRIFKEWMQAGKPGDFLSYLASKYAPVGAANDPKGLNRNWLRNVSSYLEAHTKPGGPATSAEYDDKAYQALATDFMQALKRKMAWPQVWAAVQKRNPGMDQKRAKAIWDAIVAKTKNQPNRHIDDVWQWIQHLFPGGAQNDVWNQQP